MLFDFKNVKRGSYKFMKSVSIGSLKFGGKDEKSIENGSFPIIAGPCSIEGKDHYLHTGKFLKDLGIQVLRGGIYKARTNPHSFQGIRESALEWLPQTKKDLGLPLVSEVNDPRQIEVLDSFIDAYQVGTRNMFNYELLKELGKTRKPVILKRGFSALIKEWLLAAEYLVQAGNEEIILCERGIRSFETLTRNTLDLTAVAYLKQKTHFPVIVDPSHAAGDRDLVIPLAKASKAVGADGILVEVHPDPSKALSDGDQALDFEGMHQLWLSLQNQKTPTPSLIQSYKNKSEAQIQI
jgi:3-deoxy-7-phosphoheptulonate synthase